MKTELKDSCDQLLSYYHTADSAFLLEHSSLLVAGSLLYLSENRELDPSLLKDCRKILHQEESAFSLYRSSAELSLCFLMSLSEEPLTTLRRVEHVTEKLSTFWSSTEVLSAAMTIVSCASPFEYDEKVLRTKELLQEMSQLHPLLTGKNDLPFAAFAAVKEKPGSNPLEQAESCYRLLRKQMRSTHECAQVLSLILSVYSSSALIKVQRISTIARQLRQSINGFSANRPAAILGLLCESRSKAELIAKDILDAEDYLNEFHPMKGYYGNGCTNRWISSIFLTALLYSKHHRLSPSDHSVMVSLLVDSVRSNC